MMNHYSIQQMSILDLTEEEFSIFSTKQITVLIRKAQGATYEDILKEYPEISSPKVLTSLFMWILFGRKFEIAKTTSHPKTIGDA